MKFLFYFYSLISILSTLLITSSLYPMYILFYFIIFLFSLSNIFFSLNANFSGSFEIIIYSGVIITLFIFIIMILNINNKKIKKKYNNKLILLTIFIVSILLYKLIYLCSEINKYKIIYNNIPIKNICLFLYNNYIVIIPLSSIILMSSIIVTIHFINY